MMKFTVIVLSSLLAIGCSKVAKESMNGLDDVLNGKPRSHTNDIKFENTGGQDLIFSASVGTSTSDCKPAMDFKEITIHPGESGSIHLEQTCRGRRRAAWGVLLAREYGVASIRIYSSQVLEQLQLGAQLFYGDRDSNIKIPVTIVAEKMRVKSIPLSHPVLDQEGVAWISNDDFHVGFKPSKILRIAVPMELADQSLYVYTDQDFTRILDFDDPKATDPRELRSAKGSFESQEIFSPEVSVRCDEDGCNSN